jgi:hypothetical protein
MRLGLMALSRRLHLSLPLALPLGWLLSVSSVVSAQHICDTGTIAMNSARFADNGDGTVTDTRSRLMWMRCHGGQQWQSDRCEGQAARLTWQSALQAAVDVNRRAQMFFNDWRVPKIHELATIAELRCINPRVDLSVFPGTLPDWYWTASVRHSADNEALVLSFGPEGIRRDAMSAPAYVRLVRSAQ